MTRAIMRIVALGDRVLKPGVYLKSFDHEAHDGQGEASFTDKIDEAMIFGNAGEAFDFWNKVPKCRALRPDGRPNKPLSATTIEIEPAL